MADFTKINMCFKHFTYAGVESEWFWFKSVRNESVSDKRCYKYLKDYYPPKFTYQDFGPMLTMDFFDAAHISDLVAMSGAKYVLCSTAIIKMSVLCRK